MSRVTDFLKENSFQYFSTVGLDGKPKVRPFQYMLEEDGKLYFCTSNKKDVYKQMAAVPYVEICAASKDFSWVRLSGKAVFSDDVAIKAKIQQVSPLVKSLYKTPDNPEFEIFYLDEAVAVFYDFSGNPPVTYRL